MGRFFNQLLMNKRRIPGKLEPMRREYNAKAICSEEVAKGGIVAADGGNQAKSESSIHVANDECSATGRDDKEATRKTRSDKGKRNPGRGRRGRETI